MTFYQPLLKKQTPVDELVSTLEKLNVDAADSKETIKILNAMTKVTSHLSGQRRNTKSENIRDFLSLQIAAIQRIQKDPKLIRNKKILAELIETLSSVAPAELAIQYDEKVIIATLSPKQIFFLTLRNSLEAWQRNMTLSRLIDENEYVNLREQLCLWYAYNEQEQRETKLPSRAKQLDRHNKIIDIARANIEERKEYEGKAEGQGKKLTTLNVSALINLLVEKPQFEEEVKLSPNIDIHVAASKVLTQIKTRHDALALVTDDHHENKIKILTESNRQLLLALDLLKTAIGHYPHPENYRVLQAVISSAKTNLSQNPAFDPSAIILHLTSLLPQPNPLQIIAESKHGPDTPPHIPSETKKDEPKADESEKNSRSNSSSENKDHSSAAATIFSSSGHAAASDIPSYPVIPSVFGT